MATGKAFLFLQIGLDKKIIRSKMFMYQIGAEIVAESI
jgi:hypothetical protein